MNSDTESENNIIPKLDDSEVENLITKIGDSFIKLWQYIFNKDDDLANIITRAVEAFRLEFCGEGNIIRDPATIQKYLTALIPIGMYMLLGLVI